MLLSPHQFSLMPKEISRDTFLKYFLPGYGPFVDTLRAHSLNPSDWSRKTKQGLVLQGAVASAFLLPSCDTKRIPETSLLYNPADTANHIFQDNQFIGPPKPWSDSLGASASELPADVAEVLPRIGTQILNGNKKTVRLLFNIQEARSGNLTSGGIIAKNLGHGFIPDYGIRPDQYNQLLLEYLDSFDPQTRSLIMRMPDPTGLIPEGQIMRVVEVAGQPRVMLLRPFSIPLEQAAKIDPIWSNPPPEVWGEAAARLAKVYNLRRMEDFPVKQNAGIAWDRQTLLENFGVTPTGKLIVHDGNLDSFADVRDSLMGKVKDIAKSRTAKDIAWLSGHDIGAITKAMNATLTSFNLLVVTRVSRVVGIARQIEYPEGDVLSAASRLTMQETLGYDALLCPTVTQGSMKYPINRIPNTDKGHLTLFSDIEDDGGNSLICNLIHTRVAINSDNSFSFQFDRTTKDTNAPISIVTTPDGQVFTVNNEEDTINIALHPGVEVGVTLQSGLHYRTTTNSEGFLNFSLMGIIN
ncbi:hypothetical protein A3D84_01465 [Candidatus Woesebacteria bacterium RIFCSPHIGHO2_02_FULL_42_20]|nr:MAG: hypothetical protein A3D84_01465 [Candidatus Woesebacteria bacterium RIFCSPHIGHO2_02_FULL_42_20]